MRTNFLWCFGEEGKDAIYTRTQPNNRIEARALEGAKVPAINNVVYLEKTQDLIKIEHLLSF